MLSKSEPNSGLEKAASSSSHEDMVTDRPQVKEPPPITVVKPDEIYDCCICRLSSVSTPERPIGMVALIQPTSGNFFLNPTLILLL